MTMQNHIRFGLKTEDHSFTDIVDVQKERQYGGIYPPYHISLIAR